MLNQVLKVFTGIRQHSAEVLSKSVTFSDFRLSQGSVATYCRWGGRNLCDVYIENVLTNRLVKEFRKSVHMPKLLSNIKQFTSLGTRCNNAIHYPFLLWSRQPADGYCFWTRHVWSFRPWYFGFVRPPKWPDLLQVQCSKSGYACCYSVHCSFCILVGICNWLRPQRCFSLVLCALKRAHAVRNNVVTLYGDVILQKLAINDKCVASFYNVYCCLGLKQCWYLVRLQAQRMAHMQMKVEKRLKKKSPIAEVVSIIV